jgi:3-dehydroquinate synthase
MRIVNVHLGDRAYPIFIGAGARRQLAGLIETLSGIERIAFVADQPVAELHLEAAVDGVRPQPEVLLFPEGEASKSVTQLERLYDGFAAARLGRRDLVVTLGGGVAGDLAGFAAATWMRGVRFIQMPTTLEAALDASIGGKTGINHAAGKNLIGAFHQPSGVLIDTDFLQTLSDRDFVAGLAESVKHAAIRDAALFDWHERHAEQIVQRKPDVVESLIASSCEIKADVVARDEREDDLRMILNYGHTIGHAIEHLISYELRHGECVALGMIAENEIATARGVLTRADATRVEDLLAALGLPIRLPKSLDPHEVAAVCHMDKKVCGGSMNFVLITGLGEPRRVNDVTDGEIVAGVGAVQPA